MVENVLSVTYFLTNLVYPFTLRVTGTTKMLYSTYVLTVRYPLLS